MVKNTHGGSGHKKFARKFASGSKSNKLRVSEDEGEIYSIVTKMLGNGMFHCYCIDGEIRLGHIRGKFSGRGKRDNMVEVGKWVLIGLREWDIVSDKSSAKMTVKEKLQHSDLLEVYSESDKTRLKETVSEEWHILDENDISKAVREGGIDAVGIEFSTKDDDINRLMQEIDSATAEKIVFKSSETKEDEADVDVFDL